MAVISKNNYPRAMPLHSPEELATQNSRLSQWNEELAAQAKRLNQQNKELAEKAQRLRRWTLRLTVACGITLVLAAGAVAFTIRQARAAAPAHDSAAETLPTTAVAKPDGGSAPKVDALEALGGLSAAHLFQSHLNIGLLADGVENETYTIDEADKNLQSVSDLMNGVDAHLAKLAKSGLDAEDQASIRQIQAVAALLHLQAKSLRAYWATGAAEQAAEYHEARKASWSGLSKVLGTE